VLNLETTLNGQIPIVWEFVRTFLLAFSFATLVGYGVRVLSAQSKKYLNDFIVGLSMVGLYVISLLVSGAIPSVSNSDWVITADFLARILLASPGALITSLALSFQSRDSLAMGRVQLSRPLKWAGIGFALYGITQFIGPIVSLTTKISISDSEIISYPIPTARALLAGVITISIIRMTQSLEQERRQELEQAQDDRLEALKEVQYELKLRNNMRKELLRRTVILQEEERTRISRELHDDTAQTLTAFNANLAALRLNMHEEVKAKNLLGRLSDLSDQMADSIYKLVKDLRPAQLDELGIHAALQSLIDKNKSHLGLEVEFEFNKICDRLDPVLETVIYRIVQESLTNVAKYAESASAIVRLIADQNMITIEIEDQGRGFDTNKEVKAGFGLMGLDERTQSLGGVFVVSSKSGSGTIVSAKFPLNEPCLEESPNE
ncbi:MAG: sensor histidine kinase, partial [Chloroflexi bacterium]|nr:sensor histidine kinase [Chloroflexota bacterium]